MSTPRRPAISERFKGRSEASAKTRNALLNEAIGVRDSLLEQKSKFAGFEQRANGAKNINDLKVLEKELLHERAKLRASARRTQEITRVARKER